MPQVKVEEVVAIVCLINQLSDPLACCSMQVKFSGKLIHFPRMLSPVSEEEISAVKDYS